VIGLKDGDIARIIDTSPPHNLSVFARGLAKIATQLVEFYREAVYSRGKPTTLDALEDDPPGCARRPQHNLGSRLPCLVVSRRRQRRSRGLALDPAARRRGEWFSQFDSSSSEQFSDLFFVL
jgi:hypothetical protein